MAAIKCKNCKSIVSSNDKLCPHCGAQIEPEMSCPKCGSTNCTFKNFGQIIYTCEKCDCRFTNHNGITEEYIPPEPKSFNAFTAYLSMWKRALDFKGRSSRAEYWWSVLWFWMIYLVLLVTLIFGIVSDASAAIAFALFPVFLAHAVPLLALSVRRLHDTGKSGGYLLFNIIPTVGNIIVFIANVQDSDFGDNQYGPNPKGLS